MSPARAPLRVVYSDLDGTMVGPGGCFVRAEDGSATLEPARALIELLDAGVTLVLVSGRTRPQLLEAARMVGADGFVGEMGAVLGWDRGRSSEVLAGAMPPDLAATGTPAQAIAATGAVERLLERHAGRLELHAPWHEGHEADVMLRGRVDPGVVEADLAAEGLGWLRLLDNGALPPVRDSGLGSAAEPAHVYHLMPAGLGKGLGVARDLARRGFEPGQAVAIGDSASDLTMADAVGHMWLTANGARHPDVARQAAGRANVTVTDRPMGLGWAEAVRAALA